MAYESRKADSYEKNSNLISRRSVLAGLGALALTGCTNFKGQVSGLPGKLNIVPAKPVDCSDYVQTENNGPLEGGEYLNHVNKTTGMYAKLPQECRKDYGHGGGGRDERDFGGGSGGGGNAGQAGGHPVHEGGDGARAR